MANIFADIISRGPTDASAYWTKAAIAAIGKSKDRAAALTSLAHYYDALVAKGIDVQAVENEIERKFPR